MLEVAGVPGRSKRWVAPDILRVLGADDGPEGAEKSSGVGSGPVYWWDDRVGLS